MRFEGVCTYPHGWNVTVGLFVVTLGATACVWYAICYCRFVVVEYSSSRGNFDGLFLPNNSGGSGVPVRYKTAAGLFTWLRPNTDTSYYDDGTCRGYSQLQRDGFSDHTFEALRAVSTVAILLTCFVLFWLLALMSVSFHRWYIRFLAALYLLVTILVGLCYLVFRSGLCGTDRVGTEPDVETLCSLDEGGLVGIAGAILWFLGFLIVVLFLRPLENYLIHVDGEIKSSFQQRQDERRLRQQQQQQGGGGRRRRYQGKDAVDYRGNFVPGQPLSQTPASSPSSTPEREQRRGETKKKVRVVETRKNGARGTPETRYGDVDSDSGMEVMYHI